MANVYDGFKVAEEIKKALKEKVTQQSNQQVRVPHLAIIAAGDNPGNVYFVRRIIEGASEIGFRITLSKFPFQPQMIELNHLLDNLQNPHTQVDGIYVQLPLPDRLNEVQIISKVPWAKDVGDLRLGLSEASNVPTSEVSVTSAPAVLKVLEDQHWNPEGKQVLIVGESNLVKPLAMLLLEKKAIITIAENYSDPLKAQCQAADLIVSAVGKPNILNGSMIKKDSIVIDAGFSLDEKGNPCGDVDTASVKEVASLVTPMPGGVDETYISLILQNTWNSYLRRTQ
ncbi:MAG: bifunctional 5,10-methylenetetrahydrofolate dehydrogenase/5,10-methenyltetrahydrofolate cyclohydrolase [Burkholderiales bacterium]|nr:bifunctional 5,10-methylenetetrahydrofolate dehydrogenase/5,10-methenyltetrahydrofolate cyclohydrolase [Burkholderiales bacterium]